jgi:subtilisin family serine protease
MRKTERFSMLVLVITALVLASTPLSLADRAERVLIEYVPGKKALVRGAIDQAGGQIHYEFDGLQVMAATMTADAVEQLRLDRNVRLIEQDARRYPAGDLDGQAIPYGIDRVQAPAVWEAGHTGDGIKVCIIDSGLYPGHEDIDESKVDGEPGWDTDGCGHGTHVAGTVAAWDNDFGVVGVSPGVSLHIVRVFGDDCLWAYASDLMDAAMRCAEAGANIISMSLSGSAGPGPERKAYDALYEQGILSVAAASNDGNRHRAFPASYDSVISVAATDINNNVADFSNQNKWVELAAPGVNVLSTVPFVAMAGITVDGVFYEGLHMEYAPYTDGVSGPLVDGGLCTTSGDWSGQVVLCERGDISFAEKVANAMAGGGVAAVIYNNAPGGFSGTLGAPGDYIPAISISQEDGQYLVANELGETGTVESHPPEVGSGYEAWGGTSMATPHVSGVAALLWSAYPSLSNLQIRDAMTTTALDLGEPGRDIAYGFGLVQAWDALQYLDALQPGNGKGPHK